ncbi:putative movement protein [Grapevine Syrah virus 1]|uniref:Putative movement protein n=1 Tax=Grapevine Syrah virus 1 TaxID=630199 RepID=C1J9J8_9VIRU|nr:putative movement protein [Grapevine Syrah virus 1]ACO06250.1 putative movement protein [Grapevine Syrah virus 1]
MSRSPSPPPPKPSGLCTTRCSTSHSPKWLLSSRTALTLRSFSLPSSSLRSQTSPTSPFSRKFTGTASLALASTISWRATPATRTASLVKPSNGSKPPPFAAATSTSPSPSSSLGAPCTPCSSSAASHPCIWSMTKFPSSALTLLLSQKPPLSAKTSATASSLAQCTTPSSFTFVRCALSAPPTLSVSSALKATKRSIAGSPPLPGTTSSTSSLKRQPIGFQIGISSSTPLSLSAATGALSTSSGCSRSPLPLPAASPSSPGLSWPPP